MERIGLMRAASIGALVGVAGMALLVLAGDKQVTGFGDGVRLGFAGALGGAFWFAMGAIVVNRIRGR